MRSAGLRVNRIVLKVILLGRSGTRESRILLLTPPSDKWDGDITTSWILVSQHFYRHAGICIGDIGEDGLTDSYPTPAPRTGCLVTSRSSLLPDPGPGNPHTLSSSLCAD